MRRRSISIGEERIKKIYRNPTYTDILKGRVAVVAAAQRQHLGVFPVHVVDIVHQVIGRDEVRGAVARIGHLGGLDDLPRVGVRYAQPLQHFNVHIRKAKLFQLLDSPIGNGPKVVTLGLCIGSWYTKNKLVTILNLVAVIKYGYTSPFSMFHLRR